MNNQKGNKINGCLLAGIIGVSLFTILLIGIIFVLVWFGASMDGEAEHGVLMGNKLDEQTMTYIQEQKILNEGEEIIVYYDYTMALDATEAGVLTNQRVIYYNTHKVGSINLEDITKVEHSTKGMEGDFIEVTDKEGMYLVIEVAPFNDGDIFYKALTNILDTKGISY